MPEKKSLRRHWLGLWLTLAAVPLLSLSDSAGAQPAEARTTVFIGNATLAPGERTPVDLVVRLDPAHALDEFALTLSFDPQLITVTDVKLDPSWIAAETGSPASAPGQLSLSGLHATGSCPAGSSCHLATLILSSRATGEAVIDLSHVLLLDGGVPIPDPTVSSGRLQPRGSVGAPTPAIGTVAGARGPGTAGSGNIVGPASSSQGTGGSVAAGMAVFIILAIVLVGGSALLVSVVRRSWRWSSSREPSPVVGANILEADASAIAEEFGEYLSRVEAFGRVVGRSEDDELVHDVATAFANNPGRRAKQIGKAGD
ncbi:MAG: cohesin domain-containing protein [Tepidiformaceae bacterium]